MPPVNNANYAWIQHFLHHLSPVGVAGFVRCLPSGCVVEVNMDDKLIEQLSNGTQATFVIFDQLEEGTGVPLVLTGFKDGYAKLP